MQLLQVSEGTAAQRRIFFQAVDATDGITAETGLTGAGRISKNGAATAASSANIVEVDSTNMPGRYYIELTAAELDTVGVIEFRYKSAACAEVVARGQVVPFDPYDAVRLGLTTLPNANAEAAGGLYTRGTGAGQINQQANGQIDVNQERMLNVAQSVTDLKDFADDGYDPATNKVAGVVLVDTLTTYTGNTPQTGDSFARLGAPAGASVSADVAAIKTVADAVKAKTDQLTFTIANKVDSSIQAAGDFAQAAADKVWSTAARTLTAFGFSVTVGTNNDKTGYSLSGAAILAIWDALTAALTTVGSIGKLLVDNINATISSRLASASYTAPDNASITAIKAKTDNLPAAPAAVGDIPTANQNADALLDRANAIETGLTPRGALRLQAAALAGELSGAATNTVTIRNAVADSKDRIVATVDPDGNRTAVVTDVT